MTIEPQNIKTAQQNAAGLAAKQLCTLVYVSGLDPELAKSLYVDPLLSMFGLEITVEYDTASHRVLVSSTDGSCSAAAVMRNGIGCTITTALSADKVLPEVELPPVRDVPLPSAGIEEIENDFDLGAVETALDRAFSPSHNTLATVVLHNGKLVAERYHAGITASTPLPGWSMAKSVAATLVGLLVKRGKIDILQKGIVRAWRDERDGRELVTLDHLLRMTSGLDLLEDQSGSDPNSRMLFVESDMAAFAAGRGIKYPPRDHWEYMSGSTLLACKAIFEASGGTLQHSQTFYREAFMKPLGAASFVFETDVAGTFVGSSHAIASPHDWAKFGQLYLNDGIWQGERLLPEGWLEYVTMHTPQSGANSYGAAFWTVEHTSMESLPKDTFYANGFQGQYVIIIPSQSLVIVRLGASHAPDGIWQLASDIVSAKR